MQSTFDPEAAKQIPEQLCLTPAPRTVWCSASVVTLSAPRRGPPTSSLLLRKFSSFGRNMSQSCSHTCFSSSLGPTLGGQVTRLETESKGVGTDTGKHLRLVTSRLGVLQGRCSSNLQIRKQLKVTSYWATQAAAKHASLTPRSGLCSPVGEAAELSHSPQSMFSPSEQNRTPRWVLMPGSEVSLALSAGVFQWTPLALRAVKRSECWLCSSWSQGPTATRNTSSLFLPVG